MAIITYERMQEITGAGRRELEAMNERVSALCVAAAGDIRERVRAGVPFESAWREVLADQVREHGSPEVATAIVLGAIDCLAQSYGVGAPAA